MMKVSVSACGLVAECVCQEGSPLQVDRTGNGTEREGEGDSLEEEKINEVKCFHCEFLFGPNFLLHQLGVVFSGHPRETLIIA